MNNQQRAKLVRIRNKIERMAEDMNRETVNRQVDRGYVNGMNRVFEELGHYEMFDLTDEDVAND